MCAGSDVTSEGANEAFYATFSSTNVAAAYVATLGSSAATQGDCNTITLGEGEALCHFQDENGLSGSAVMYVGPGFTFGPNGSTSAANCALINQPSTSGASVLVWNYSGTNVVGGLIGCGGSVQSLTTMRTGLINGDYELNNQ